MFDLRIFIILLKNGWFPGRNRADIEKTYIETLGLNWIPEAGFFIRRFGGLSIYGTLWITADQAYLDLEKKSKITSFIKCDSCPVATSNYMGISTIWIDEKCRFYAVDDEGMLFLGQGCYQALSVLLFGTKPSMPPMDIRDAMINALQWNKN